MPRSRAEVEEATREERWSRFRTLLAAGDYELQRGTNGCIWLRPRRAAAMSTAPPELAPAPAPSKGAVLAERLEKIRYEESRCSEHFGEKDCAICLVGFVDGDVLAKSPCSHVFHGHCLVQWFDKRSPAVCPLCRSPIT